MIHNVHRIASLEGAVEVGVSRLGSQKRESIHLTALNRARRVLWWDAADPSVVIVGRRSPPPDRAPVAVLASFTTPTIYVYALWPGMNRVGQSPPLSDYEEPPVALLESGQWLIMVTPQAVYACDDRTSEQSCYIGPEARESTKVTDPRFHTGASVLDAVQGFEGAQRFDWYGTVLATLEVGGVLLSQYAGFAFGRMNQTAPRPRPGAQ